MKNESKISQSEIQEIKAMKGHDRSERQDCIFWIEKHKSIMAGCVSKCEGYYFNKEWVRRYSKRLEELENN